MNTDLSKVFIDIAKELNIPENVIQDPLKILNSNFFFRLQDIKRIDNETWTKLNLPLNLYFILQDKIKLYENNSITISNPQTNIQTQTENIQSTQSQKPSVQLQSTIVSNLKSTNSIQQELENIVEAIMIEAKVQSEITSTLKILFTIIENIVKSPLDESLPKINIASKSFLSKMFFFAIKT